MGRRLIAAAMGADLATWLLVPQNVRAAAESNPLVTSFAVAFLLKFAAILAIFGLLTRLKHHRWVAVAVVVALTLVGAGSNLRAVRADGPSHPEPVLRWAPVIVPPSPTASAFATHRPTPSGHTQGVSVSGTLTWYCRAGISRCTKGHPDGPGLDLYAAAGPPLRVGDWRGRLVTVCATRCIQVRLIDWCACAAPHFLDLYWDAFRLVGPGRAIVTW